MCGYYLSTIRSSSIRRPCFQSVEIEQKVAILGIPTSTLSVMRSYKS